MEAKKPIKPVRMIRLARESYLSKMGLEIYARAYRAAAPLTQAVIDDLEPYYNRADLEDCARQGGRITETGAFLLPIQEAP